MADSDEGSGNESQLITEFKDGQLQIVEVVPFKKDGMLEEQVVNSMPELEGDGEMKYIQLVNSADKSSMQLDLVNLQLVKSADGMETFKIVTNDEMSDENDQTITYSVLNTSDNEANEDSEGQEQYMVMQADDEAIMFVQPSSSDTETEYVSETQTENESATDKTVVKKPVYKPSEHAGATTRLPILSPADILAKAKAMQKAKSLMKQSAPKSTTTSPTTSSKRGRKRKSDLPPPHELLATPGFKLFLYSCKFCDFKCNAVKEMRAHKLAEHVGNAGVGGVRYKGERADKSALQCARCPYKGHTHMQLVKHVKDVHLMNESSNKVYLNTEEVEAADILVCGACGFESASRRAFRVHIEKEHGATAVTAV